MARISTFLLLLVLLAQLTADARGRRRHRRQRPRPAKEPTLVLMPPDQPPEPPAETAGSFGPDVYVEDITNTLRLAFFNAITVSPHDPKVAYLASYDGYVWKTVDGGQTWDESRLLVERRPFYGDSNERIFFGRHRMNSDDSSDINNKVKKRLGRKPALSVSGPTAGGAGAGGGRKGSAANANFGIGVPGGAPRLQLLVRKFNRPTSGLNIKQTLWSAAYIPLEVRTVVVSPHDPNIVFACTMSGLFKSYDGGLNWVKIFTGMKRPWGWRIFHLAVDPGDPKHVLVATGEGLYISHDGGDSFSASTKGGVGKVTIDWIYFNPYNPKQVFVGTDYGLLRSNDSGVNWKYIYFTTFPDGRVVRSIVIDPFDHKTGYIATHDGLYYTPDMITGGMEDWKRLGGLKFTGLQTHLIVACTKHKGHLWTLTNMKLYKPTAAGKYDTGGAFVYETVDGGKTWKIIFSGHTYGSMSWFDNHPDDPDMLWIAWSRAVGRLRRHAPQQQLHRRAPVALDDPPMGQVFLAAQRYMGIEGSLVLNYRRRSRLKALVPRIDARYLHHVWDDYETWRDGLYDQALPFRERASWLTAHNEFRVMLRWDLSPLVFNLDSTLFGRIARLNAELRGWVWHEVQRLYGELRRLRALMYNQPPRQMRVRLMYRLRIEELTSYINFISGNYLTRWHQGNDHPDGMKTKWWEPWPVKKVKH